MSTGDRKDARYIAELMEVEGIIQPYDPDKSRSTLFGLMGPAMYNRLERSLRLSSLALTLCMAESMW
jgi:hypothetical protein